MKKRICALVLIALLCTAALAQDYFMVNANNVVVRVTPDKDGYKVGNVDQYTKVKVLGTDGNYTNVEIMSGKMKGETGYIFSDYINISGVRNNKPAKGLNKVVRAVYLRSYDKKPDTKNGEPDNIIKVLSRGTKVTVKKITKDGWAQLVNSKGTVIGYCYSTFLDHIGD